MPDPVSLDDTSDGLLSVGQAVARAYAANFSLEVSREDAAFLVGIHRIVEVVGEPTLTSDHLRMAFRCLDEVTQGLADSFEQRTTNAIGRLTRSGLLRRVDGGSLTASGEFYVPREGVSVVQAILAQEELTQESLQVLMEDIRARLAVVLERARQGGDAAMWRRHVAAPLRLTVTGLIEAVDRRQQGLEMQQQGIKGRIQALLDADWAQAIDTCEELLDHTSATLQELHKVLLSEAEGILRLLNEIEDALGDKHHPEVLEAVDRVRQQVESISRWAESRQTAWGNYYGEVHSFIRGVVRVDPTRVVRHRLREAIQRFPEQPWFLRQIDPARFRAFRSDPVVTDEAEVSWPTREAHTTTEEVAPPRDLLAEARARLEAELASGHPAMLIGVVREMLCEFEPERVYAEIGRIVHWMATEAVPGPADPTFVELGGGIECQEVVVHRGSRQPRTGGTA
jgi:chromosome partition protein MukF